MVSRSARRHRFLKNRVKLLIPTNTHSSILLFHATRGKKVTSRLSSKLIDISSFIGALFCWRQNFVPSSYNYFISGDNHNFISILKN
uniref:Ovule protein n=1 Tax=Strongyloides venezuelensis TaxID=75913 RepID=A0A0K0FM82_STRVS